jgi:hypothetical protein
MFNTAYRRSNWGSQARTHNGRAATPALLISLFGLLMLGDGITGIRESDSEDDAAGMAFVITTGAAGLGLLFGGVGVFLRKDLPLVFTPFATFLFTALFACHVVVTGEVLPAGLMVILGLVALVLFYRALPSKENSKGE